MASNIKSRLRRLEEAAEPSRPWVLIDERDGDPQEQIQRRREAREIGDNYLVVILRNF